MRLPVTPQISTKDGVSAKNARLTNVLKETRKTGELAVVRPGLETVATTTGNGGGLVCFNGELVSVYGATLGFGVDEGLPEENLLYLPLGGNATDSAGHTTALVGSGVFSSAQSVCASESFKTTAETDYINVTPKTPDTLAVGESTFTIECWVYVVSHSVNTWVLRYVATDFNLSIGIDTGGSVFSSFVDIDNDIGVSGAYVSGWCHIAAVCNETDWKLYVNGVYKGTVPLSSYLPITPPDTPTIWVGGGNAYFSGFRYTNTEVYTGAFTPACYSFDNSIPALATIVQGHYDFTQSPL